MNSCRSAKGISGDDNMSRRRQGYTLLMAEDNHVTIRWSESAPYWEKHREIIRKMFAPITEALIADARIIRGYNVLDVGTGPGEPALSIARFVGREGKVYGIDPAPEMIAAA